VLAKANNNLIDRPGDACGSQVQTEEAAVTSSKCFSTIFVEELRDSFYTLVTSLMGFESRTFRKLIRHFGLCKH
jgi:hypothetical protein